MRLATLVAECVDPLLQCIVDNPLDTIGPENTFSSYPWLNANYSIPLDRLTTYAENVTFIGLPDNSNSTIWQLQALWQAPIVTSAGYSGFIVANAFYLNREELMPSSAGLAVFPGPSGETQLQLVTHDYTL